MNSKICFLKSVLEGEERILESKSFHSTTADREKSDFKEAVISFNERQILWAARRI